MLPEVGLCTPAMTEISVDLPAPFSRNSTCTSPRRSSSPTSSRATTPGKCLEMRLAARRTGAPASSRAPETWTTVSTTTARGLSLHSEGWLEAVRSQGRVLVERLHIGFVDHIERRTDMLFVRLLLQDAHHLVDRNPALDDGGIGRSGQDRARLDAFIDRRREVIGDHLDLVLQPTVAQQSDRRLSRR